MPWTHTFHRQAMLNRTTRILKPIAFRTRFHGETIKMLWLKRSCYDLKRSQRFHAKTSPLQWLKTECYDLTLPLVANGTMRKTQPYTIHIGIDRYSIRLPHVLGGWGPNGLGHQDISGNSSTDVFAENEAQHGSKSVVRGGKEKNYLGIAEWGAVMRYWGKSELYYIVHSS